MKTGTSNRVRPPLHFRLWLRWELFKHWVADLKYPAHMRARGNAK